MTKYPPSGLFNNGAAPGITAQFLNNVEQYLGYAADSNITADGNGILTLLGLKVNPTAVTVNGQTSGTATLYQLLSGSVKACLLFVNNYYNTGVQSLNLPTPFASQFWFITTGINQISFYNSGAQQTCQVLNTVSATGGSYSNQTLIKGFVQGQCITPVSQIQTAVATSANTGLIFMIGN